MSRSDQWKLVGVLLVTILAGWYLYPSYRFYNMTPAAREAMPAADLAKLRKESIHLGLDLQGGLQLLLEVDKSKLNAAEAKDATDRAMEIIRNRVDQFGVAEPLIQREGQDRIAVQLPGLTDRGRAIELIGKTALLEFKVVRTGEETKAMFEKIDGLLAARGAGGNDSLFKKAPLTGHMIAPGLIRKDDVPAVEKMLASANVDSLLPGDSQLTWGSSDESYQGTTCRALFVLKRQAEMTGGSVASADASTGVDQMNPASWGVKMTMTPAGRSDFARVTGANVDRRPGETWAGGRRSGATRWQPDRRRARASPPGPFLSFPGSGTPIRSRSRPRRGCSRSGRPGRRGRRSR